MGECFDLSLQVVEMVLDQQLLEKIQEMILIKLSEKNGMLDGGFSRDFNLTLYLSAFWQMVYPVKDVRVAL